MRTHKSIIVVDDCADTSEMLKIYLELDGYIVCAFTDLDSAKRELGCGDYCGALLDFSVNGSVTTVEEFIREMKRTHPDSAIFISSGDHRVSMEWRRLRADGFFLKPVPAEILSDAFSQHCPRTASVVRHPALLDDFAPGDFDRDRGACDGASHDEHARKPQENRQEG